MTTAWASGDGNQRLMGRWSERLAPKLIEFAGVRDSKRVLDVGCGTGSLSLAVLAARGRSTVVGIDPSPGYLQYAGAQTVDPRVKFEVGDAQQIAFEDASFDTALALLVINFVPDAVKAVFEMRRVTKVGGVVAGAVWDYGDGMAMLRTFWDVAESLDPAAERRHERNMPTSERGC